MSIAGMPTVGELADLIKSYDYQVSQMRAAYADASPTWVQQDQAGFIAFTNDWQPANDAYDNARNNAQSLVNITPSLAMNVTPAGPDGAVYHALADTFAPFQGLYGRLTDFTGKPVDFSQNPQPTAPDVDLNAMNTSTKVLQTVGVPNSLIGMAPNPKGNPVWNAVKPYVVGAGVLSGLFVVWKVLR